MPLLGLQSVTKENDSLLRPCPFLTLVTAASLAVIVLLFALFQSDAASFWLLTLTLGLTAGVAGFIATQIFHRSMVRGKPVEEPDLSEVFEQAGDALFVHQLDGRLRLVNRQACVILGYDREELLNLRPWDFVPLPKDEMVAFYHALQPNTPHTFDTVCRRKDGSEFPVEGRVVRYQWRGAPTIVGLVRDVSDRKRAEAAQLAEQTLRSSEERNRAILGGLTEAVILVSSEGRLLLANPSAERMLGLAQEDLQAFAPAQRPFEAFHEDGSPWPFHEMPGAMALATGEPQTNVVIGLRLRGGEFRWALESAQPLRDAKTQKVWGVVISFLDITARKKAETALRESEERLRSIFRAARLIVWALDRQGIVTFSDGSGLAALGLKPGETVGRSIFELYAARPDILEQARQAIAGEEVTALVPINDLFLDTRYAPLRDATGNLVGTIGVATDVSERYRAEEALVRLRDELEARVVARTGDLTLANEALQAALTERQRAEQLARGQKDALIHTLQVLADRPGIDDLLGHVLAAIAAQVGAELAEFWFYDGTSDSATTHIAGCTAPGAGLLTEVSRTPVGRSLFVDHDHVLLEQLPEGPPTPAFRDWSRDRPSIHALLLVPLVAGPESIGSFSIGRADARPFQPEEVELARALAYQATLAIQLTRFAENARQSAVLEERNRMAREIHDTLAQGFAGIILQLEMVRARPDARAAEANLDRALMLARQSLQEARRSIWALRPGPLETGDLPDALRRMLAQEQEKRDTVCLDFHSQGNASLPAAVEENLLRVAQESLTNALTHGRPQSVAIDLTFEPGLVRLSVVDDGVGFDPRTADRGGGFGLTSMRERVARLGGTFALDSAPDQGTTVTITVPFSLPRSS
jgi:PAS domain S-box-containing protein